MAFYKAKPHWTLTTVTVFFQTLIKMPISTYNACGTMLGAGCQGQQDVALVPGSSGSAVGQEGRCRQRTRARGVNFR